MAISQIISELTESNFFFNHMKLDQTAQYSCAPQNILHTTNLRFSCGWSIFPGISQKLLFRSNKRLYQKAAMNYPERTSFLKQVWNQFIPVETSFVFQYEPHWSVYYSSGVFWIIFVGICQKFCRQTRETGQILLGKVLNHKMSLIANLSFSGVSNFFAEIDKKISFWTKKCLRRKLRITRNRPLFLNYCEMSQLL